MKFEMPEIKFVAYTNENIAGGEYGETSGDVDL